MVKIPTVGTIGSLALLGGMGYVLYQFATGNWKIPNIFGAITPDPETIKETGIVGGVGDVIYNIFQAPELRERVEERADVAGIPYSKAVAEVVSEDIHEQGLGLSLLKAPVTIGAGLGAIAQQGKYLESLPEDERIAAERLESEKRLEFRQTPEGVIATAIGSIFPPTAAILAISGAIDVARTTAPEPKAVYTPPPGSAPIRAPWAPEPPPAAAPWKTVPPPAAAPWAAAPPIITESLHGKIIPNLESIVRYSGR